MSTLFLSYSHRDRVVVEELRNWLAQRGYHSLFLDFHDQDGIQPGKPWQRELHRNLSRCHAVLALCSKHFSESHWCFGEVLFAKLSGKMLVPLQLDASPEHPLLDEIQAVDFTDRARTPADAYSRLASTLTRLGLTGYTGAWDSTESPYPGLKAFEEAYAPVFFGRDEEVEAALAQLRQLRLPEAARCLLILGASGSGKSSLLRAGVLPRLKRHSREWISVEPFQPGTHPFTRCAQALATTFQRSGEARAWEAIRSSLLSGNPDAIRDLGEELRFRLRAGESGVLIAIDQLEEALLGTRLGLYPHAAPGVAEDEAQQHEMRQFVGFLQRLMSGKLEPFWLIATLRSDFLGELQTTQGLQGARFKTFPLGGIASAGFERVIRGPAELAGIELGPGLTERMVADTKTADALPLLAFTLRALYDKRSQDGVLTLAEYAEPPPDGIGGLQGALAQAAEDVLNQQDPRLLADRLKSLRRCFLSMVVLTERGEPTRRPALWSDLPSDAHGLLEQFVQARLLVSSTTEQGRMLEVAHEALFRAWSRLANWLAEAHRFLAFRRELDQHLLEWCSLESHGVQPHMRSAGPLPRAALLKDDDLLRAKANLEQYGDLLTEQERRLIQQSADLAKRRRWLIRGAVSGTLAILTVATLVALRQSARATDEARVAKQATLVAAARLLSEDATRTAVLMRETDRRMGTSGPTARILQGHTQALSSLAINAQGTLLATASDDGTAKVWRLDATSEPLTLSGHTGAINVVAFDTAGQRVLTGSLDRTIRVWNSDGSGAPLILSGQTHAIDFAAFSRSGQQVLAASVKGDSNFSFLGSKPPNGSVQVWDLAAPTQPHILVPEGAHSVVTAVSLPGDQWWVATAEGASVKVWRHPGASAVLSDSAAVRESISSVSCLAFDGDGHRLAAGSENGLIRVWRDTTDPAGLVRPLVQSTPWSLKGHASRITALAFSPDGERLVSGATDGTAIVWDLSKIVDSVGSAQSVLEQVPNFVTLVGHRAEVTAVAWRRDGMQLATASADATARVWNRDGTATNPALELMDPLTKSMESALGSAALRRETAWQTLLDDMRSAGEPFSKLSGHSGRLNGVVWNPDGRIVATASADGSARIWRLDGPFAVQFHTRSKPSVVALSADGDRLLEFAGNTGELRNVDGSGGVVKLEAHAGRVTAAAFSPDQQSVLSSSLDHTARLWSIGGERPIVIGTLQHPNPVDHAAFHPSGKRLLTLARAELRIWNVEAPAEPQELAKLADVKSAAFSPDGENLAVDSFGRIEIWSPDGREQRTILASESAERGAMRSSHDQVSISGFRFTRSGADVVAFTWEREEQRPLFLLWKLGWNAKEPTRLPGYTYDFVSDSLIAAEGEPIALYSDGQAARIFGDALDDSMLSRSPNGRRAAMSNSLDDDSPVAFVSVLTLDVRTLHWREVKYCLSELERRALLGETKVQAQSAVECCRATLRACETQSFGACAATVKENYADPLNPCDG